MTTKRPSLNFEEAQKMAVEFETLKYVAPPKSGVSVLELLENVKRKPGIKVRYADNIIQSFDLEKTLKEKDGAVGYFDLVEKGMAYNFIGQYAISTKVYEKALSVRPKGDVRQLRNIYAGLFLQNFILGNADKVQYYFDKKALAGGKSVWLNYADIRHQALLHITNAKYEDAITLLQKVDRFLSKQQRTPTNSHHWGETAWIWAELFAARGQYREAEDKILSALGYFEGNQWGEYGYMPYLQVRWAAIKNDLGQSVEAELIARNALVRLLETQGKTTPLSALAVGTIARSLLEQGKISDAIKVADVSIDLMIKSGVQETSLLRERLNNLKAAAAFMQNDWIGVLQALEKSKTYAANRSGKEDFISNPETLDAMLNGLYAQMRLKKIQVDGGLLALAQKFAGQIYGADGITSLEVEALIALDRYKADASQNKRERLLSLMARAGEKLSVESGERGFAVHAKRLKLLSYEIARLNVDDQTLRAGAFHLLDRVQSSSVEDALVKSRTRALQVSETGRKGLRDIQDLKFKRTAIRQKLAQLETQTSKDIEEIKATRARLNFVNDQLTKQQNVYGALAKGLGKQLDILQQNEGIIRFDFLDDQGIGWLLKADGQVLLYDLDITSAQVTAIVEDLRHSLEPQMIASLQDIPDFDGQKAYWLYEKILAPMKNDLKGVERLHIVSSGVLSSFPLQLLVQKKPEQRKLKDALFSGYAAYQWLVRDYQVSYIPSVTALASLRHKSTQIAQAKSFIGVGDPVFNEGDETHSALSTRSVAFRNRPALSTLQSADLSKLPQLPDTRYEIETIAKTLDGQDQVTKMLGLQASESNFKAADLESYKVLHLATHGLLPGDLDGLNESALAFSNPKLTGEVAQDGLLTSGEIMEMNLNADWVILSACNTAVSENGAEAYNGLGSAFFYAGARALLLSNWPVHSGATASLMTHLFEGVSSDRNSMQAYQDAMVHLIDQAGALNQDGKMIFSYAHPIFWAPFSVVGDAMQLN